MEKQLSSEYTFLGKTIKEISVIYGGFLIFWSALVSYLSASQSFTSWIPAFLGIPILFLGLLSKIYTKQQKLFMHLVVLFGILCVLGGLDLIRNLWAWTMSDTSFSNIFVWSSKLVLLISGLVFCYLCIKSFLHIRNARNSHNTMT